MKLIIRWKKDAARIPAVSAALLVVLAGGALMRMTFQPSGWMPWRSIAMQGLLVFVLALFAALSVATLARRPEQLRRELRARDRRLRAVHERLAEALRQRDMLESQIGTVSRPDPATPAANRAALIDRLARAQQHARHDPAAGVAVIAISLDRSTPLADGRWRPADDQLLRQAVRRIEVCLTGREHAIARVADNALGLLLVGMTSIESARAEAGRVHQALSEPFTIGGQLVFLTPTMGVALPTSADETAESQLQSAHLAMERAIDNYRLATAPVAPQRPRRGARAGRHVQVPG